MSPSEDDLRAALRHGEGATLDPDAAVAAARAHVAHRRMRLAAVSGTAVVVLAVGATVGVVLGTGGSDSHPTSAAAGGAAARTAQGGSRPSADTAGCPKTFTTAAHGAALHTSAALIPASASTVLVCAYGSTGSGDAVTPATTQLTGSDAQRLIASLNAAATSPPRGVCPMYRVADDHRLTFIGITANSATDPVSTTLGNPSCTVVVTSSASTRYAWSPPEDLKLTLFALHPTR